MRVDLLSFVTFLPMIGAILLLFIDTERKELIKRVAFAVLCLDFVFSVVLWFFVPSGNKFASIQQGMVTSGPHPWIEPLQISYFMGLDGISLLLVLMTTFLAPLVLLGAWERMGGKVKGFCFCILLMQTGMLGAFMALDLFLFYIFWEVILIPLYFLIGIWGGKNRAAATMKFLLYTLLGSVLMLVAILYIGVQYKTYNILELYSLHFSAKEQYWLFGCFALAFLVRVPMFPFHTWLPETQAEAPTAASVILAGVLLKIGVYGFIRLGMPLFPDALAAFTQPLMILAVIGVIYGALVAMVQPDLKKLIAYASISQLGLIMLGLLVLNTNGVQGGILHMVNHGLSTGALFLMVGMLYERRQTRTIADFGGIAKTIPVFAFFFMVCTLSAIGLPGLNGFVGEFLILLGIFSAYKLYAIVAGAGLILSAVYMLWMYRRMMFGPINNALNHTLKDLELREVGLLTVICVAMLWLGLAPGAFLNKMGPSVDSFISTAVKKTKRTHTSRLNTHKTLYRQVKVTSPSKSFEPRRDVRNGRVYASGPKAKLPKRTCAKKTSNVLAFNGKRMNGVR